jgi:hypothetical protein
LYHGYALPEPDPNNKCGKNVMFDNGNCSKAIYDSSNMTFLRKITTAHTRGANIRANTATNNKGTQKRISTYRHRETCRTSKAFRYTDQIVVVGKQMAQSEFTNTKKERDGRLQHGFYQPIPLVPVEVIVSLLFFVEYVSTSPFVLFV